MCLYEHQVCRPAPHCRREPLLRPERESEHHVRARARVVGQLVGGVDVRREELGPQPDRLEPAPRGCDPLLVELLPRLGREEGPEEEGLSRRVRAGSVRRPSRPPGRSGAISCDLVRSRLVAGRDEVLDLHLLELARAEDEVARRDLVAERLADLRDAKGNLEEGAEKVPRRGLESLALRAATAALTRPVDTTFLKFVKMPTARPKKSSARPHAESRLLLPGAWSSLAPSLGAGRRSRPRPTWRPPRSGT